jgi:hypothetical protein
MPSASGDSPVPNDNVQIVALGDVFQLLELSRKTGVLTVLELAAQNRARQAAPGRIRKDPHRFSQIAGFTPRSNTDISGS